MLKASGVMATILVILALVATLLKQIIAFIGFLTTAIQIIIVLVFVAVFLGIGVMIFRSWSNSKKNKN